MTDDKREATFNDGAQGPRKVTVNYPNNSKTAKAAENAEKSGERPRQEKVISGDVVQRKKGLGRKIVENFSGDSMENVKNYVIYDLIIPQVRALFVDVVTQSVERKFLGSSRPRTQSPASRGVSHVSYNNFSRNSSPTGRAGEPDGPRSISARSRAAHDFDEIVIENRGDAEYVIDTLAALIDQYKVASVGDLYDLCGISSQFTDQKWGWSSMKNARVLLSRGGYVLDLPPTEPING